MAGSSPEGQEQLNDSFFSSTVRQESAADSMLWKMGTRFRLPRLFFFTVMCCFAGMLFWMSPTFETRVMQWRVISLQYAIPDKVAVDEDSFYQPSDSKRVAICLVGGARAFELTGPSIKQYLLDPYEDADVFVHSPADSDVHKLTLLDGFPHLASIRIFKPKEIEETKIFREVLTARGSPHGIQGLLQYFRLVEGCLEMIQQYENLHNFKYSWVIRTRLDGYWNAPMPPINVFNGSYYYVPFGSGYGGFNDRLGLGTRELSSVALARLSLLPEIHKLGYRHLYSEIAFEAQFKARNVGVELSAFPFCVLSVRKYGWPPKEYGVPVLSIRSKGPLNGAKCRPCTPTLVGAPAEAALNTSDKTISWVGPTEDPQLCDPRGDWEENWEGLFDEVAGQPAAEARLKIRNRTFSQCMADIEGFQHQWEVWDVPSARELCEKLRL